MRSAGQSSVIYMKKLRMKKNFRIAEQILIIIPFLIILAIISRTIPDGTVRLNIGESGIGEKAIALTFDDGPSDYTEELLDGLEEYEASVTFFVIGSKAEKNPDIVERAHREGHLIGNHTYSHIDFYKTSLVDIKEDLTGENILIVEDIIDSGNTLNFLKEEYLRRGAKSVKIMSLLDKPSRRKVDITPDYTGFVIEDKFVVGYGLDNNEKERNIPYVGYID